MEHLMNTTAKPTNETTSIVVMMIGLGAVFFAVVAGLIAAATSTADLTLAHFAIGAAGLYLAYKGRNSFGHVAIANDYHAQAVTIPASKYTPR